MTDFEKDNFCSLEARQILKEVGFDENCIAYWNDDEELEFCFQIQGQQIWSNNIFSGNIAAPTFLSARKWLREKHGIDVNIEWDTVAFGYKIIVVDILETIKYWHFQSEPEAWNAAIIRACEILKERK